MKNQLELNFGMLTVEQQECVDRFKRSQKSDVNRRTSESKTIQELLLSGGFEEGIDFVNDFKCKEVTETRSFGYGDDEFEEEVTFTKAIGGCCLITDYFDTGKNQLVIRKTFVSENGGKLECSTVTSQYRAYKPSSLLTKLKEYNEREKGDFERAQKTRTIIDFTVEKYKLMFPKATVTKGTDYNGRYSYNPFPIVKVEFESGSYITFRLGGEKDKEYIHKKFDGVASKMNAIEMLNIFNNQ